MRKLPLTQGGGAEPGERPGRLGDERKDDKGHCCGRNTSERPSWEALTGPCIWQQEEAPLHLGGGGEAQAAAHLPEKEGAEQDGGQAPVKHSSRSRGTCACAGTELGKAPWGLGRRRPCRHGCESRYRATSCATPGVSFKGNQTTSFGSQGCEAVRGDDACPPRRKLWSSVPTAVPPGRHALHGRLQDGCCEKTVVTPKGCVRLRGCYPELTLPLSVPWLQSSENEK